MITKSSSLYTLRKKWEYSSKCLRWLCPLQTVEVILSPGEAETSGSCWSLSFEVERRCCCWLLPKLLAPQVPGLPLVMRLLEEMETWWSFKHKVVAWSHPTQHLTCSAEQSTRKSSAVQKCESISLPLIHICHKRKILFLVKKAPNLFSQGSVLRGCFGRQSKLW